MFLQRFIGSVSKPVHYSLSLVVLMTVLGGQTLAGEATTPGVARPSLALYGVIQKAEGSRFLGGESQKRARWYAVGDQIEGFEVRQISAESVLVSKQGVDFTLSFPMRSDSPEPESEQPQTLQTTELDDRRAFVAELSQSIRGRFGSILGLTTPEPRAERDQFPDPVQLSTDLSERMSEGLFQFNLMLDSLRAEANRDPYSVD